MFLLYDTEFREVFYGLFTTIEKAEEAKEKIWRSLLADALAVDSEDSGIKWKEWSDEAKEKFVKEITNTLGIKELTPDEIII